MGTLWNTYAFYVLYANIDKFDPTKYKLEHDKLSVMDKWILSRITRVIKEVTEGINNYRFNDAANILYNFIWKEFCDWYLELIKPNMYSRVGGFDNKITKKVIYYVFLNVLKLLHPIMPFVTEEIYQRLPVKDNKSIMISNFPVSDRNLIDEESERDMSIIMGIIDVIRNIRGETGIAPNTRINAFIRTDRFRDLVDSYSFYIMELAKLQTLSFVIDNIPEKAAIGIYDGVEILVPVEGLIDVPKEIGRIEKELSKIEEELKRLELKIKNPSFLEKAPEEVINKNKMQYNSMLEKRNKLIKSRDTLIKIQGD